MCKVENGDGAVEPIDAVEGGKGTVELSGDGVIHLVWKPRVYIEAPDAPAPPWRL